MPAISPADLVRLRTTKHAAQVALSVYKPALIWSALVDGGQADGDRSITVKNVINVRTPARHYLVRFFDAATGLTLLGEARWYSYVAPTLNVSAHNTPLADNTIIRVYEEIKPTAVHVTIDDSDVVSEDGNIAYTNENTNYMPLARIGCPAVAYRDEITGLATVRFWADPEAFAGAIASHAWNFRDGTPATSVVQGTAVAPNVVTFPSAGSRYISYTVTDTNGKTHTRYVPIFIYDNSGTAIPYTAVEVTSLEGDVSSGGWRCSLRVLGDADKTEFPDNGMIVLSSRDFFGDEEISIGGQWTWRENIVFTGYIANGSVKKNYATGAVEFEAEGVALTLDKDSAEGGYVETGTPGGWHVLSGLTFELAAHHVLTQHTTISNVADVNLNLLDYSAEVVDLPESGIREQLDQAVCKPTRCRIGSSAQGMVYLEPDPQLIPVTDRAAMTVVLETEYSDFRGELEFGNEPAYKNVSQIDFCGEDGGAEPIYSLAPAVPYQSGKPEQIDGVRADTQAESNILAGIFDGAHNNPFDDVTIPWRGNYRVFDVFPAEPIEVSIAAVDNLRGIEWINQRVWTKRIQYEYHGGILLVTSVVAKDAVPSTGITGYYPPGPTPIPPTPPPTPPTPTPPTPPTPIPPVPPVPLPLGKGNLLYASTLRGLAKCVGAYTNPAAGVWTNLSCDTVSGGATLVSQNGVSLFNDGTIDWTTTVAVGDRIVADDNTIDGEVVGIVDATELTLNTNAFVANKTFKIYNLKAGLQSADALHIRWFNLDPHSIDVSGDHLTAGWTMTDDGLYRVTGLPNTPVWTRQLTAAQAQVLISSVTVPLLTYRFTPSVFTPGYIALGICPKETVGGRFMMHYAWSLDYGVTWSATIYPVGGGGSPQTYRFECSSHVNNRYFVTGNNIALRSGYTDALVYNNSLYETGGHVAVVYLKDYAIARLYGFCADPVSGGANLFIPYCNSGGGVYPDDNVGYLYNVAFDSTGTHAIRRYTTWETPLWRSTVSNDERTPSFVGDAAMGALSWFFTNTLNEDYAVGIETSAIWFSTNISQAVPTWVSRASGVLPRTSEPVYLFCVPADPSIVFFLGKGNSGAIGCVFHTVDFGTNFITDDLNTAAGSFTNVLRLTDAGDVENGQIIVDPYCVTGTGINDAAGIDVSHWQGAMNWATAAAAGVGFAFIKATEGTGYTDPQFAVNWAGALAAGISRGAYHYFRNTQDPTLQANHFLAVYAAAGGAGELNMALDCEEESTVTAANIKTFLDRIETVLGYKATIYTRASWWNTRVGSVAWASDYPLWVAHWGAAAPTLPTGWVTYSWWQYSSSGVGATYGAVSATIDLNRTV